MLPNLFAEPANPSQSCAIAGASSSPPVSFSAFSNQDLLKIDPPKTADIFSRLRAKSHPAYWFALLRLLINMCQRH